jgi:hypothetical protein
VLLNVAISKSARVVNLIHSVWYLKVSLEISSFAGCDHRFEVCLGQALKDYSIICCVLCFPLVFSTKTGFFAHLLLPLNDPLCPCTTIVHASPPSALLQFS